MRWDDLSKQHCSVARTLAVIGDRWTLLILRDCFMRLRRFEDFQKSLGLARRVLTERLGKLVDEGILKRVVYQENPLRHEYKLTKKGLDLYPVVLSLVHWGDQHYADESGPPILHRHKTCGHDFRSQMTCSQCGEPVGPHDVEPHSQAH
jgi:DNA-binding HxlR family transcriptional regulator